MFLSTATELLVTVVSFELAPALALEELDGIGDMICFL
jgi:hypothetical protein